MSGGIARGFFVRFLIVTLLFLGTQFTRYTNRVSLSYDGNTIEVDVDGTKLTTKATLSKVTQVSARVQSSMAADPVISYLNISSAEHKLLVDATFDAYLFGTGIGLGALRPQLNQRIWTFGDWSMDRTISPELILYSELLNPPFRLETTFLGRGEKYFTVTGDRRIEIAIANGFLDNAATICIDKDCSASHPDFQTLLNSFTRVLNFFLEIILLGYLIVTAFRVISFISIKIVPKQTSADSLPERSSLSMAQKSGVLLALLIHAFLCIYFSEFILGGIPHIPDSASYLRMAILLSKGLISVPALPPGPQEAFLGEGGFILHDKLYYLHHNHFWPAILMPFSAVGAPNAANISLSLGSLLMIFLLGKRFWGPNIGILASFFYAISPFSIIMASDYLNHMAVLFMVLFGLCSALSALENGKSSRLVPAGTAWALAVATRPLTGVSLGLAFAIYCLIFHARSIFRAKNILFVMVGATPVALLLGYDNYIITNDPFLPIHVYLHAIKLTWRNIWTGGIYLDAGLAYLPPILFFSIWPLLFLALGVVPAFLSRSRQVLLLSLIFFSTPVGYLFFHLHGFHGYGPRFYFESSFSIYLLTACGIALLCKLQGHAPRIFVGILLAAIFTINLFGIYKVFPYYTTYNGINSELHEALKRLDWDHSIYVSRSGEWQGMGISAAIFDPYFKESFVIRELPNMSHCETLRSFPERKAYQASGTQLIPYVCPADFKGTIEP